MCSVSMAFGAFICGSGRCGKGIYALLLVLFYPEEWRLAVPDALPCKPPRPRTLQHRQMLAQPRTCRTVSEGHRGVQLGGAVPSMLVAVILQGINSLLLSSALNARCHSI